MLLCSIHAPINIMPPLPPSPNWAIVGQVQNSNCPYSGADPVLKSQKKKRGGGGMGDTGDLTNSLIVHPEVVKFPTIGALSSVKTPPINCPIEG